MKVLLRKLTLLLAIYAGLTSADAYASPCPVGSYGCYRTAASDGTPEGFLGCCKKGQICSVDPTFRTLTCLDMFSSESEYQACLAAADRVYLDCMARGTNSGELSYCEEQYDIAEINCKASWPASQDEVYQKPEQAPPLPESPPQEPQEEQRDDDDKKHPSEPEEVPSPRWIDWILGQPVVSPEIS